MNEEKESLNEESVKRDKASQSGKPKTTEAKDRTHPDRHCTRSSPNGYGNQAQENVDHGI